ncbi:MAG TPA: hypothetical protein VFH03_27690 [Actinoplanes sp.]|nr:hypothetical protein [Actinoplanes sp.]
MTGGEPPVLRGWTLMVFGLLAVVLGGLWTLQGLDLVGGSVMSGVRLWSVIGPVVVLVGLILIVLGVRRRARFKHRQQS